MGFGYQWGNPHFGGSLMNPTTPGTKHIKMKSQIISTHIKF